MTVPFEPRVAVASLSGESDAEWALAAAEHVGAAVLGGLAVDEPTREAARAMVDRERTEFLPTDPVGFADCQLAALDGASIDAGVNVRAASADAIRPIARVCADHDATLEINAHCRQAEMCDAGAGHALLREPERLARYVEAATDAGATTSVKVRTEVEGVDLPVVCRRADRAGADVLHVDTMDSEPVLGDVVAATDAAVIGNNGVRDRETAHELLAYGADAVSVGRPSDDPAVLDRVRRATVEWFRTTESEVASR